MLDNSFDSTAASDDANTAILVNLNIGNNRRSEELEELRQLAVSAKLTIFAEVKSKHYKPNPATYAGKGKIDEISELLKQTGAKLVIFNNNLSPVQQRNLEDA